MSALLIRSSELLMTEHAVLAFPEGRHAVPVSVVRQSDVLKRVVGVPAAQAAVSALMPRSALQLWSLHVQQHLHHETIEDLCTVVKVGFFNCWDRLRLDEGGSVFAYCCRSGHELRQPSCSSCRVLAACKLCNADVRLCVRVGARAAEYGPCSRLPVGFSCYQFSTTAFNDCTVQRFQTDAIASGNRA